MRITESTIKRIIREELEAMMGPERFDPRDPSHTSAMRRHFSRMERGEDEPKAPTRSRRFPGSDDDEEEEYLSKLRGDWDKQDRRARGLDEATSLTKSSSPREKLESYLLDHGDERLVDAVMSAIDGALDRAMDKGESPTSEDVTFNISDKMLDLIPQDDDDEWHEMIEAVLDDEFDMSDFEAAEAEREREEETRRDLGHWSNFIPSRRNRY